MHVVDRMTQSPPNCMICGVGNTPDTEGNIGPFLDLERDVNWGDSTYLCESCGSKVGASFGMITTTEAEEHHLQMQALKKKLHDKDAEIGLRRRRERQAMKKAKAVRVLEQPRVEAAS